MDAKSKSYRRNCILGVRHDGSNDPWMALFEGKTILRKWNTHGRR